jgi:hypothetical protein
LVPDHETNHAACHRPSQRADDGIDIQDVRRFLELIAPLEINVLPGDGGDLFAYLRALRIPASFLLLLEPITEDIVRMLMHGVTAG